MKKVKLRIKQFFVIIKYVIIYVFCKIFKVDNKDVWVVADRGDEARDNGFAFYKYLKKYKKDVNVKFVIDSNSKDINRIIEKEDIIYKGSIKNYILFITAGYLISSHIMGYSPEFRIFTKLDKIGILKVKGKKVFLQHGITKDYARALQNGYIRPDLFICGAQPEYEFILNNFGFNNEIVKYTGFSRYDFLEPRDENYILIMPTWRMKLFYCKNEREFKETEYYKKWNELLKDEKLLEFLKDKKLKLIFYPHYEFQKYVKCFNVDQNFVIVADFQNYDVQKLLCGCKMLITDFSSVFFDVAYMNKPIIYYQFDYEEYRKYHYAEGYYDYIKDGFGPVTISANHTVSEIISYYKKDFKLENKYIKNVETFFRYKDKNNSERIFKCIINLRK